MKVSGFKIALLFLALSVNSFAQADLLGVALRPGIKALVGEIEKKAGRKLYAEFVRQKQYQFGESFIDDDGLPVVLVNFSLKTQPKKLEAVIAHELLHLRLRTGGFPVFLFSPSIQTAKGRAIDVEQSNINDLTSLIEHRVFKSEMERLGVYDAIDPAGDTAQEARRSKGKSDGQADAINYARAILEYRNARDTEEVRKAFAANGWTRSLKEGREIADLISLSKLQTPQDIETVFLKCLLKLYPIPRPNYRFSLTPDRNSKFYRQMIINTTRVK